MEKQILEKFKVIDFSVYPDVHLFDEPLKEALWVLLIYQKGLSSTGYLDAKDISDYLLEVDISRKHLSISRALARAGNMVDKKKSGNSTTFKIMKKGEDHLLGVSDSDRYSKRTLKNQGFKYVHAKRIDELKIIKHKSFDLSRLIQYCEESNKAYANVSYLSVGMLGRAIIDHVPPIFECNSFIEVVTNYKCAKSFRETIKNLNSSLRKIADSYLHLHIRAKEILPNSTQIDFSNDLDMLLGEIVRVLK